MRALVAVLALLVGVVPVLAQGKVPGLFVVPLGFCELGSISSATKLTTANCTNGSVPAGATMALIRVETAPARFRDDGVAPTACIGFPLLTSDEPFFYSGSISQLQFIQQSSGAVVDILFYK